MKVSINWIRDINSRYQCAADPMPHGIDALVEKIGAQLGAVEEVVDLGKRYEGIVVAKVVSCEKHPNADKLSICLIDDGKKFKAVKRNKQGLIQIVHGAKNVEAGQLVAWMPPGVTVPSTIDKDPLTLEARKIRGVTSNGMVASAKELGLGDDHTGILIIDEPAKPGQSFAKVYGLDDYIVDIENKMFTHRPDLFGQLGIARELAGIQQHVFKSPVWYQENPTLPKPNGPPTHQLSLKNQIPKLVPRFCVVAIKDIKVSPSPSWLKAHLSAASVKSVNNIVDITNWLMLETAQPIHAYDYDQLSDGNLGASLAKAGEELTVLGGKKVKLTKEDIVITSGDKVIGLGGVMGGVDTEVGENTTNIALEVANFNMNSVRKSAMHHGLFTEAATRFTKNQSPRQNLAVLVRAVDEIKKIAGGRQASQIIDKKASNYDERVVHLNSEFVNLRLGLELSPATIKSLLENVEFSVGISDGNLSVKVPFWRMDVEIAEDIVEEVGRLYGYDHLPLVLASRDLSPTEVNQNLDFKNRLRQIMQQAGGNELLTYSFIDSRLLDTAGQKAAEAFHVRNALSPDLQYYRLSLTPSLQAKVHANIKAGYKRFLLFEVGQAHVRGVNDKERLPAELQRLAVVTSAKSLPPQAGAAYFQAKHIMANLLNKLSIYGVEYLPLKNIKVLPKQWQVAASAYEPRRSALVKYDQIIIGLVGEPHSRLSSVLKLLPYTTQLELDIEILQNLAGPVLYQPLNRFPSLEQDFCLRSETEYSYGLLDVFMRQQLNEAAGQHGISYAISTIDIFQKPNDKRHKQTTWRINLWHPDRTLTTEEVNKLLDIIADSAKKKLKAERI